MNQVFLVTATTTCDVEADYYDEVAQELVAAFQKTLGSPEAAAPFVPGNLTRLHVRVEVSPTLAQPDAPIAATAVVDIEAESKPTFNKPAFSTALQKELSRPVKINKRAVAPHEL